MLCQEKTDVKNQLKLFTEQEDDVIKNRPLEVTTLLTMFRECFIAEGYENRAAQDSAVLRGEALLRHFFAWWQQEERTVLTIESGFKLDIGDAEKPLVVSGRFDRIEQTEKGLRILDYKTSAPRTQESVDLDLQLSIYALAAAAMWQEPVERLSLLFLGEDGVTERSTVRNASQLRDAVTTIRLLHSGIEHKDFTALPAKEKCRVCPYRQICPAAIR